MRVLAIDTALAACSAAVFDSEQDRIIVSKSVPMTRGHAEALMPIVARLMDETLMTLRELDRVVVTTGPGSFTGLRVGISAARGIAVAIGKPAVGVSTLSAYAGPYVAIAGDDALPVVAAIDARHDHVYLQVFDPDGETIHGPRIASLREAARAAAEAPAHIVGSAAQAVADALSATDPRPASIEMRGAPDIAWVARIGATLPAEKSPPVPQYLRAPDAQPQNASQLPRR